jgi:alpha-L-fucosidase 2
VTFNLITNLKQVKKYLFLILILSSVVGKAQTINWPEFMAKQDLVWNNNVDSNFFHGAFIGDGIQGAMIMQDSRNPNGLRMLMSHYKAIAHYSIPNYEYCDSKVYAGNIIIAPVGKRTRQTMRMNLYDGETSGLITTDEGTVNWRAFGDRKNNVFVVVLKGENGETEAKLDVREEWGITPRIYLDNKNVADYATYLPPKPQLTNQGNINLVINKMKSRGAHVVASQLIREVDNTQILYVAIGTSDVTNVSTAAVNATNDAVKRVQDAVSEGYQIITARHRDWWHNYMKSSYLEIKQDTYWQKFWYIQLYKFACASAENSDLIMDTQGAWIWKSGWAAVWWNLNVQLSYFPMYSANKLDAGRAFINGMDRIYKSGAFRQNANGYGITIGRSSTYEGKGNWGEEFGNMPWLLQLYWKYWKYSGNDVIGKSLFPMLKDNAVFLSSKLKKGVDGKYHLDPSRSPEYEDTGGDALHKDANYGLMSAKWVFQTLLEMDTELELKDAQRSTWQEKLTNLADFPADDNGFRVNADQGFDYGHRHFSHLIGIYPYHIINPDQGKNEKGMIEKSVERWQNLTQANGAAGYTFTAGCAMYATLGNGEKAISTLDLMKTRNLIQLNTMYYESGGAVIETPLAAVESIDYMLLQSWNGVIRLFPAVPARWKDISFKDFRTEGAFLVSANYSNGIISDVTLFSEKGKACTMLSPWKGKFLIVKNETGKMISVKQEGEKFIFKTQAGEKYFLSAGTIPEIRSGKVEDNPKLIQLKFSEPIINAENFYGIVILKNVADTVKVQQTTYTEIDSVLAIVPENVILNSDELSLNYSNGNIQTKDNVMLQKINNMWIENLLPGSSPRLTDAKTNFDGSEIVLVFNKKMNLIQFDSLVIFNTSANQNIIIDSLKFKIGDSTTCILFPAARLFLEDTLVISYSGTDIQSFDNGKLKPFDSFPVENVAKGLPPQIIDGIIVKEGAELQLIFNKKLNDVKAQLPFFTVKINGKSVKINSISNLSGVVSIVLSKPVVYRDSVFVSFSGGIITSADGGELKNITDYQIINTIPLPKLVSQSTTSNNGLAKLAVDGITDGYFTHGSVTHTNENSLNPWWTWDLAQLDSIVEINIWNRTDCCGERLSNFYVFVSREPFNSTVPATVSANPAVWKYYYNGRAGIKTNIKVNTCGQYVRIQIPGNATLSLAEVEVLTASGKCLADIPDGIKEFDSAKNIVVYPNPVDGQKITVDFSDFINPSDCDIQLFDILGRPKSLEIKQKNSLCELEIKDKLQSGIYFLVIKAGEETVTKKLIF